MASDVVYEETASEDRRRRITPTGLSNAAVSSRLRPGLQAGTRFPAYVFAPFRDYNKGNNVWSNTPTP